MNIEYTYLIKPMLGSIDECGDTVFIYDNEDYCLLGLIDVLGHGREARTVANIIYDILGKNHDLMLDEIVKKIDEDSSVYRGAVIFICKIHYLSNVVESIGVGNISTYLINEKIMRIPSEEGIIGTGRSRRITAVNNLKKDDVLVMFTDGVQHQISNVLNNETLSKKTSIIARRLLLRNFKGSDDASCIVVKCLEGDCND